MKKYKDGELAEKLDLKWYVLNYDFNRKKMENFNIFNSSNFLWGVSKALKEYESFGKFKEEIDNWLKYSFWSKSEYEIACGGLFVSDIDDLEKIDVYYQMKDNVDVLCRYILTEYNKRKRKKIEF